MTSPAGESDRLKRAAATAAADLVSDGMIVGLGTGSTASFAVEALALRVRGGLRIRGIPTSERTAQLASSLGIPLTSFTEHLRVDLTIDGADEVERDTLDLIKGLGGALLREKIVAAASDRLVIIVDSSKLVERLGTNAPVPVEVVPFGWEVTAHRIGGLGARVTRRSDTGGQPFVSDGGHLILDCAFGQIGDPVGLDRAVRDLVGVVETGLFIGLATEVLVGEADGVRLLRRQSGKQPSIKPDQP